MSELIDQNEYKKDSLHPEKTNTLTYDDETVVWEGSPSQWTNLGSYIFWGAVIIGALIFQGVWSGGLQTEYSPTIVEIVTWVIKGVILFAFLNILIPYLSTRYEHTQITRNKIKESRGITSIFRNEKYCEISDITDIKSPAAGLLALFGLSTLVLETNDEDQPIIRIRAIRDRDELIKKLMPIWRELVVERKGYFGDR